MNGFSNNLLQQFYESASTRLEKVDKSFQKMIVKFKSLLEYFGEDPNLESDAFLGTVFKFISNFEVSPFLSFMI
jgi:hypothetical protein